MATATKFLLLGIALLRPSAVDFCYARSTFGEQEIKNLSPYLYHGQVYKNIPTNGEKLAFFPNDFENGGVGYQEPSSRDLDIGFAVGEKDEDGEFPEQNGFKPVKPIRNYYVPLSSYRDRRPDTNEFNIGVFTDPHATRLSSSGVPVVQREPMLQDEGPLPWHRSWSRHFVPRFEGQNAEYLLPIPVPVRDVPQKMMLDTESFPGVTSQELVNKVGELKLRSDRGYQLSMHVPPASVGDRPGVLKMDMKATLFRPIYY